MLSYNIAFLLFFILSTPYLLVKFITKKRFRYRLFDRISPKPIEIDDYILVHLASLGEAKAFLNIKETIEDLFKKKIVFSVTSNIGYDYLKSLGFDVYIAPIDFYPLYKKLFKYNLPFISIFFETEIWPSYINFIKKSNIKIFLINARMSEKSYKSYNIFKVFSHAISQFDCIMAKSEDDKKKFSKLNKNVRVCENIKYALKKKEFDYDFLPMLKFDNKKIFVFASLHRQELEFLKKAVNDILLLNYRVILVPRYLEDLVFFENFLKNLSVEYVLLSQIKTGVKSCILVDSFGVLESIYSVSSMVFVGGSLVNKLNGHNPIEPAIYKNFVFCGLYMNSFNQEVEFLKKLGCIFQVKNIDDLKDNMLRYQHLHGCDLEQKRSEIMNCYKKIFLEYFTQV